MNIVISPVRGMPRPVGSVYALLMFRFSFVFFISFFLTVAASNAAEAAGNLTGIARVVDGDTLVIDEQRIRMHGIDAPEMKQSCMTKYGDRYLCGESAKLALIRLIDGNPVRCEGNKRDRYKRLIAVCYARGIDLNGEMVALGWALAYTRYSKDYLDQEARAMSDHMGMWNGEFIAPWRWRRSRR